MTAIQQITDRWLQSKRSQLGMTARGEPRDRLAAEIAVAEKHFAAKNEVVALAAKHQFRRNDYAGTCVKTGVEVKPGAGFARKDGNKWQTYSFAAVQEIVGYKFEE